MTEGMANASLVRLMQSSDIVEEGGEGNTDLDAEVGDDIEE